MSQLRYPNVPAHAQPKPKRYNTASANGLTAYVVDRLNEMPRSWARRVSSEGRYRKGDTVTDVLGRKVTMAGRYLPGLNVGMADIIACVNGRYVAIEIKIGRDRLRPEQERERQRITEAGGLYYVIRTREDADALIIAGPVI